MGQVLLGFRSLLIKLALFVVFAALLAWALGGTLFPRPELVDYDSVLFQDHQCFWRVAVGGGDPGKGKMAWRLMVDDAGDAEARAVGDKVWVDGAGPILSGDSLYFGGLSSHNPNEHWRIVQVDASFAVTAETVMPDRLAVERQLARLDAGLPVQDTATILAERGRVLDPEGDSADEGTEDASRSD